MRQGEPPRAPIDERPARPPDRSNPSPHGQEVGMSYTIGLDWGGTAHAVCVLDHAGMVRQQFAVAHTAEGLVALRRKLAAFGKPGDLPIALERPSGLIVDSSTPGTRWFPSTPTPSRPAARAIGP